MSFIIRLIILNTLLLSLTPTVAAERYDRFIERQARDGKLSEQYEKLEDIVADPKPLNEQARDFPIAIELLGIEEIGVAEQVIYRLHYSGGQVKK